MNLDIHQTGACISGAEEEATALFRDFRLHTAVQPIFSLAHKRIVGYEALVRVKNASNQLISPVSLFDAEQESSDVVFLDRLCRHLHVSNFRRVQDNLNWLFLNVSPHTIADGSTYGTFFRELLETYRFPPERVVMEIVEYPIRDNRQLLETVAFYKKLGCLIAIDDFGAGHSNFDRIWTLEPDIVKIDRAMLLRASKSRRVRNLLSGITSLLHQAGALVLIEGIEKQEQALIALECDADFVQGFHFAAPTMDLPNASSAGYPFDELFQTYKESTTINEKTLLNSYRNYSELFDQVVEDIKNHTTWSHACQTLLEEKDVVRCYLLSPGGIQVDHTIANPRFFKNSDSRFKPLEEANSADWFRRHYLRRATIHPNQMQITRPYLSITGAHMCVTLSKMFSSPNGMRVLCCDLNYDDDMENF